jgi:hypothetical protein
MTIKIPAKKYVSITRNTELPQPFVNIIFDMDVDGELTIELNRDTDIPTYFIHVAVDK